MTVPMLGCRHCGQIERDHARVWTDGVGWHGYVEPSAELRRSRAQFVLEQLKARRAEADTSGSA